jgi:hypothetical protein
LETDVEEEEGERNSSVPRGVTGGRGSGEDELQATTSTRSMHWATGTVTGEVTEEGLERG